MKKLIFLALLFEKEEGQHLDFMITLEETLLFFIAKISRKASSSEQRRYLRGAFGIPLVSG